MARACRRKRSGIESQTRAALEEVERANALGELLDRLGAEDANRVDDVVDLGGAARRHVVGEAHDGDGKRDV